MKRVLGPENPETLQTMGNLTTIYHSQGRFNEALNLQMECLESTKKTLGLENPQTLRNMNGLAALYLSLGRLTEGAKVQE